MIGRRLDMNEGERALLEEMRALSTDSNGDEVFVGLSHAESLEFQRLSNGGVEKDAAGLRVPQEDEDRWMELSNKHYPQRIAVVMAEHQQRRDKPISN